jgi:hypothetical protein
MPVDQSSAFHRYFGGIASDRSSVRDVAVMRQRVLDCSMQLFKDDISLQVLSYPGNDICRRATHHVKGLSDLQLIWKVCSGRSSTHSTVLR